MTYTELAVAGLILAVGWDRWLMRTRVLSQSSFWLAYAILVFFQLLSNGVLTGFRIVRYNPDTILGLRLAYAPVEDVAFGFALITITISTWVRLRIRASATRAGATR